MQETGRLRALFPRSGCERKLLEDTFRFAVPGLVRVIQSPLLNVLFGTLQYEICALFTNHDCRSVGIS
jgi:hypothetical protein